MRTGATGTIGYFRERLAMLDVDRADTLLGTFGLGRLAERRFGACSHGERKRTLVARALMGRPRLLLLDEPGAGLDLPGRELLLTALARLADVDRVDVRCHHPQAERSHELPFDDLTVPLPMTVWETDVLVEQAHGGRGRQTPSGNQHSVERLGCRASRDPENAW